MRRGFVYVVVVLLSLSVGVGVMAQDKKTEPSSPAPKSQKKAPDKAKPEVKREHWASSLQDLEQAAEIVGPLHLLVLFFTHRRTSLPDDLGQQKCLVVGHQHPTTGRVIL